MSDAIVPARATSSLPRTRRRRDGDWLRNQLPMGMVEDPFLHDFVGIFQQVADTYLDHIDNLGHAFDPATAPMPMVRLLGRWIGVDLLDETMDEVTQRQIVRDCGPLLAWRGTQRGVAGLLSLITQGPVTLEDSGGVYLEGESPGAAGHVVVRVTQLGLAEEDDLVEIVRNELPASVTFELFVGLGRLWPVTAEEPADARGANPGIEESA